jgi:hypothetical protein
VDATGETMSDPVFTKHDDGTLSVTGCDANEDYPASGAMLLRWVADHNQLVADLALVESALEASVDSEDEWRVARDRWKAVADQLATALVREDMVLDLVLSRTPARDVGETKAEVSAALAAYATADDTSVGRQERER